MTEKSTTSIKKIILQEGQPVEEMLPLDDGSDILIDVGRDKNAFPIPLTVYYPEDKYTQEQVLQQVRGDPIPETPIQHEPLPPPSDHVSFISVAKRYREVLRQSRKTFKETVGDLAEFI